MRYKTIRKTWLEFLVAQLFLNRMSAPIISWLEDWYCLHRSQSSKWKYMWDKRNLRRWHEDGKNISSKKNYKLKPIMITLHTFWSIRQVLFEVWCKFKCYCFHCPNCLRRTLCFSSSIFRLSFRVLFPWETLSPF